MACPVSPSEERVNMILLALDIVQPQYLQDWVRFFDFAIQYEEIWSLSGYLYRLWHDCELGMAVGRDLKGRDNNVVAVIGDGAMTAGQAYEAMNNAGYLDSDLIVILNDNKQVSLPTANLDGPTPPVGALSRALSKLQSKRPLRELREAAKVSIVGLNV